MLHMAALSEDIEDFQKRAIAPQEPSGSLAEATRDQLEGRDVV